MRKRKSWTRTGYELSYRWMRSGWDIDTILDRSGMELELVRAADYSYQAYNLAINGWSSECRRKRFYQIKWRVATQIEELPF